MDGQTRPGQKFPSENGVPDSTGFPHHDPYSKRQTNMFDEKFNPF